MTAKKNPAYEEINQSEITTENVAAAKREKTRLGLYF